jgi:hypothetical protein
VLCLSLAACNNVVMSKRPMASSQIAGHLRPGVWTITIPCDTDSSRLTCGRPIPWLLVANDKLQLLRHANMLANTPTPGIEPVSYRLLSGKPLLIEARLSPISHEEPPFYAFVSISPDPAGQDGALTGGEVWPVECGPPPVPGDANFDYVDEQRELTNHLLPGLVMDMQNGFDCSPRSATALWQAARASQGRQGSAHVQWLRAAAATDVGV